MSLEIALVLAILGIALVLFVIEVIRMDVVALMVLGALAVTELVTPTQALSGFSNPAVVTVWAMFILSEGLSRAGVANMLGTNVLRLAGHSELRLIAVIMLIAGVLSGFMNNIGVAALMLPVVIDVARRAAVPASRLLMPLAYGTLLGGLTTLVGTPPNLLASGVLADAGLEPFGLFDFTPIGGAILIIGTLFVALIGRHFLPRSTLRDTETLRTDALTDQYSLKDRLFHIRIPKDGTAEPSIDGRALSDLGLTASAGLVVLALDRDGATHFLPNPRSAVVAGDVLTVQGRIERFEVLHKWRELVIERESPALQKLFAELLQIRELEVAKTSLLVDEPLRQPEFREQFDANVLAVRRGNEVRQLRLTGMRLQAGDHLLVQCDAAHAETLAGRTTEFSEVLEVSMSDAQSIYALQEQVFAMLVPTGSELVGLSLAETRLVDAFDFRLLAIARHGDLITMPSQEVEIQDEDLLIIQGRPDDIDVMRRLQQLEILHDATASIELFDSDQLHMVEVILDPHSNLVGRLVSELDLRDRYQLELSAIWRNGRPYRSELAGMQLRHGDALLLVGPRERCAALQDDPDFIVLTPVTQTKVDTTKAPIASGLLLLVVGSVLTDTLPIAIAAVLGATAMVVTRCLTMEDAYRAIDWRSIFLIAGMLPLGIAMEQTGAAAYVASGVMEALGGLGPWVVIAGLYALTSVATMIIPTAALVVLMGPIALSTSDALGISAQSTMMAIAIAASASFTSPISHPANVLVMGPGGYRFVDYLKLGVPLSIVVFLIAAVLLPWLWPLQR